MKILQLLQMNLGIMGIEANQLIKSHPFNRRNVSTIVIFITSSSLANIYLFCEAKSFREYTDAFYSTCTVTVCCINFISISWNMQTIFTFITHLENTIFRRIDNPVSKTIYEQSHQLVEKWTKFGILVAVRITIPLFMWPTFFISYFKYFTSDLQADAFEMPYPFWWPIEWKSPLGYLPAFAQQYLSAMCIAHISICTTVFITGSCWLLIAVIKDIKFGFETLDENVRMRTNRLELLNHFSELLELHADAKQLVQEFSRACNLIIRNLSLWSFATICGTLLLVQMEGAEDARNPIIMTTLVGEMFWSFALIFFLCEFGQRVSNGFEEINDVVWHLEWYQFPLEIQRMLPTALLIFQQQVVIPVIGRIACSRYVFDRIVHRAFSCCMIIRQIRR